MENIFPLGTTFDHVDPDRLQSRLKTLETLPDITGFNLSSMIVAALGAVLLLFVTGLTGS